ncbi:methyltransferase domain protein [Ceratobasidium sp. AG-Ba]|nr:methyltransferase domain protein [Ceratobasidium sp. AG-Ba]
MGVYAYYDTNTDSVVYHVVPSPQLTPSTIHSETESTSSGSTIESEDLPGYFVVHHGRQQPANDNVVKWFPSDNIRRFVMQYLASKSIFGGDYVGPVKQLLAPTGERQRQVLELGTKTGTWIQSMATQFPHVQFRTLDIVPVIPHVPRDNIAFEVYDFTEGILLRDGSQDAVFLNIIIERVKDYRTLLREVHRVLRPGGLIYINDYTPDFWDSSTPKSVAWRTNPRGCQLHSLVQQHVTSLGIDPDTCDKLPQWLAPDSEVWDESQTGFKDVTSVTRMYPGYPHDGFSCMDKVDAKMVPYIRYLTVTSMRDMCGLLKDIGLGNQDAERLVEDTIQELSSHKSCALLKVFHIHAIKI